MSSDHSSAPVRALLLDADGVTQHPRLGWLVAMARIGGPNLVREAFARERETITGKVDLIDVLNELILKHHANCSAQQIIDIWCRIDVDQHMLDLVDRVRSHGVLTVLATNQQRHRGSWMQQHLPYAEHFDHRYYSFELGLAKPDPAYFTQIVSELGVPAEQAVMVDDVAENVRGARAAGLRAVQFRYTDSFGQLRRRLRALGVPGF